MGTEKSRLEKIKWVDAVKDKMDEEKLISEFCLLFSSTPRTCKEILKILK